MSSGPDVSVVVLGGSRRATAASLRDALGQRAVSVDVLLPGPTALADPRIRLLDAGVAGHPAAMLDAALAAGCAPWLAFLVPGDRWHPDHLTRGIAAAERAGADWSYGSRVLLDEQGAVLGFALAERPDRLAAALRHRNAVGGPSSVLCRARVAAAERPFDGRLRGLAHWAAWAALAHRPAAAVAEPLVAERPGDGPALREPGIGVREIADLRARGRLAPRGPEAELDLAGAALALGHGRVAAGAYARSALAFRRPQDLVRAAWAVGARPARRPRYASPGWLCAEAGPARAPTPPAGDTPEISVIVATRNRPGFLAQAVASALAQDAALEVVVVDDASDDPQAIAALAFADPRVRVHRRAEQGGAGRARNDALGVARGRWLAFLDDDDLMAPRRLASHLEHASYGGFSFCGRLLVDPERRVLGALPAPCAGNLAERLRVGSLIGGPSAVIARTQLVREAGGFSEELYALGDWDLWLRLAARGARGVPLPELLVAYTLHPANMHLRAPERILEDFRRFDALHGVGLPAEAALLRWLAEELAVAGRHRAAVAMHLRLAARTRRPGDLRQAALTAVRRSRAVPVPADLAPPDWLAAYGSGAGAPARPAPATEAAS